MNKYDYKIMNQLEIDLNKIKYLNIEMGSLLAPSFDKMISGKYYSNTRKNIVAKLLIIIRVLFIRPNNNKHVYKDELIVYYKSGNALHHHNLHKCVIGFNNKKVLTVSCSKNSYKHYHDFRLTPFKNKLAVIFWVINKYKIITINFKKYKINGIIDRVSLFCDLTLQIFKSVYWKLFFKNMKVAQIIGDYDRGDHSSPFFAVANAFKIKTSVLQHGVINIGSGGYYPLVADTVFVWGAIAKKQFLELGLTADRIHITGTPIIKKMKLHKTSEEQNKLKQKYNFDIYKNLIVLAINPINKKCLEKHIYDFLMTFDGVNNCLPMIKLHPSQDKLKMLQDFPFIQANQILFKEISNEEVFVMCDLLVTHNSGIANEALLNGVNVAIFDNLETTSGNGNMLNKYFKIPLLKTRTDLRNYVFDLDSDSCNINISDLYYKVGKDANGEIIKSL